MGQNNQLNPQVVVLKRDDLDRFSVLLVKRSDTDVWTLPGGRREPGETIETTAIRETKEETGYDIKLVRQLGSYNLPHLPALGKVFIFVGEVIAGELKTNEEIYKIEWFRIDALPSLLLPYHKEKIRDAVVGKENLEVDLPYTLFDIIRHYWISPITLFKILTFYHYLKKKTVKLTSSSWGG